MTEGGNMKKQLTVCVLVCYAVGLLAVLGGCSSKDTTKDEKVVLKVYNYSDLSEPRGIEDETAIWKRFEEMHPQVEIIRENSTNEAYHQKLAAYIASGNLPDVMYLWPSGRSAAIQGHHMVKDLMPFLKQRGLDKNYVDSVLIPQDSGYLGELPITMTITHMMYVNAGLLKKHGLAIPKTFAELKALVEPLKAKGIEVIGMDNMDGWVMQSCLFSTLVGRYGGGDWDKQLKNGNIKFTDAWFVNALKVIDELYSSGVLNRNSLQSSYGTGRGNFATDKCAFFIDGDWSCSAFTTDPTTNLPLLSRDKQQNDIELMIFPAVPNEVYGNCVSTIAGSGLGFSADIPAGSAQEQAAVELVLWYAGEEVQTHRFCQGGVIPSLKTLDTDKLVKENNLDPLVAKRVMFSKSYKPVPVIDGALDPDVYNVINTCLQEIGLGQKTPEQAAADVQQAYENWLKEQE